MNKKKCDLLIRNACIVSMNSSRTIFSPGAVAISKSRIVDVGSDNKITQRIDAKEIIDAKGGIVHPGFIDAHNNMRQQKNNPAFAVLNEIADTMLEDEQEVYDRMEGQGFSRRDIKKYLTELREGGTLLKDGYDKWRRG